MILMFGVPSANVDPTCVIILQFLKMRDGACSDQKKKPSGDEMYSIPTKKERSSDSRWVRILEMFSTSRSSRQTLLTEVTES